MKDILFLLPIYYTGNFVERFRRYLKESNAKYTYDVYLCCSNSQIASLVRSKAKEYGYIFQERENMAGGEGALWFLQKKSGIDCAQYKYVCYFEESCEPVSKNWINRLIGDMEKGAPLTGWDWHFEGRKRHGQQVKHVFKNNGNIMIAYENILPDSVDFAGNAIRGVWDVPGYRDEMFVVSSKDFLDFDYPDASDEFWVKYTGGQRGYGVRAERMWWKIAEQNINNMKYPSPNIQWVVLNKYNFVPSVKNKYYWNFCELPLEDRKNPNYFPAHIIIRCVRHILKDFFNFYRRQIYVFFKIKFNI